MKICKNCNLENSDESKFCVGCGGKLEGEIIKSFSCQKCGFENDKEVKFCTNCGMQLEVLPMVRTAVEKNKPCPACAYKNDAEAKLCRNCGFVLPEAVFIDPEKSDSATSLSKGVIGFAVVIAMVAVVFNVLNSKPSKSERDEALNECINGYLKSNSGFGLALKVDKIDQTFEDGNGGKYIARYNVITSLDKDKSTDFAKLGAAFMSTLEGKSHDSIKMQLDMSKINGEWKHECSVISVD